MKGVWKKTYIFITKHIPIGLLVVYDLDILTFLFYISVFTFHVARNEASHTIISQFTTQTKINSLPYVSLNSPDKTNDRIYEN